MTSEGKREAVDGALVAMKGINRSLHELYKASQGKYLRRSDPMSVCITRLQEAYNEASYAHARIRDEISVEENGQ